MTKIKSSTGQQAFYKPFRVNRLIVAVLTSIMTFTISWGRTLSDNPTVEKDYLKRSELAGNKHFFEELKKQNISGDKETALKFLYAYMSDADMAAYPADFFSINVDATFKASEEMPWGTAVPEREFLHFVLPLRVNNEALDMSRPIFYEELKDRVKNLSMEEAILEVNHWCHEKATYRPSDGRTSSPLSTVSQAIGRCGEESTFAVAALRAVGIPARQVYTPRWAHTDDNHAWVEAWANGKWYFLGACEPEPVLNLAWFNAPASRGILMNTNVFGHYDGPEEQLSNTNITTTINVTENYAPIKEGIVIVKDKEGNLVEGATVRFGVYNYAEFYPIVTRRTDSDGTVTLTSGLGDLVVWATDGKNFALGQLKGSANDPLVLILDKDNSFEGNIGFDITPPPSRPIVTNVTEEQKIENAVRTAYEDSLRNAYTSTFANLESIEKAAALLNLDKDRLTRILTDSRGNHKNIISVISNLDEGKREVALDLLEVVSEKDRRDISSDALRSHVEEFNNESCYPEEINKQYILNPRVENEKLVGYKQKLRDFYSESDRIKFKKNPELLADWIITNVADNSEWNPLNLRMDPLSVAASRSAGPLSKKIFFVASARSLGIPSRMDLVRGEAQYMDYNGNWHDVLRSNSDAHSAECNIGQGTIKLNYEPQAYLSDPKYYSHFTISKIVDGLPHLLEYPEESTLSEIFDGDTELEAGQYMIVTGRRLADGGVLSEVSVFNIKNGESKELPLNIREDAEAVSVIGSLNAESIYHDLATDTDKSILSTTGRGYYVLGILRQGHEPSVHALNDISLLKDEFEKRSSARDGGEKIMLLFDKGESKGFDSSIFPNLPSNVVRGEESTGDIKREIVESLHLASDDLPIFVIADTFNRIVYVSQGYTIGLGEKLIRTLDKID